ncbi:putative nuclease HARBI1 [Episyrphus balteatus]|uniref:putative nuclease HARBI1 n=1 Tax=Episyrphus balteatus TaxID=286459 RepID=UPI0024866630|nr:putative nuclease HARBI1 [Episyrphus balteatus]
MDSVALFLEAEAREKRTEAQEKRRVLRSDSKLNDLTDAAFKKNFRLNKVAFEYVLQQIKAKLKNTHRSNAIIPEHKLAACLRFFAEGNYQHGVGKDYQSPIGQTTFSSILKETLDIMEETLCSNWISLKMSEEDIQQSKLCFLEKTGFPGVIGCVDGTHVQIIAPVENKHLFLNRKGHFSLNVLIICDYKMKIRAVNANYQGANHYSHVWSLSPERRVFEQNYLSGARDSWLLGDSGYALEPWLMTPFRTPRTQSVESCFNTSHKKAKNIVERTIGLLKSRFRCLLGARQLHYEPMKAAQIVNVCCALHNICLFFDSDYSTVESMDITEIEEDQESEEVAPSSLHNQGSIIRNQIVAQYFQ